MSDAAGLVATALVLLSPLVWMRLGLQRVPPLGPRERHLRRFAALAHRLAALCLCVAFALPVGPAAAWLATPWLATAIALAISGALRLATRRDLATFAEAAALAYPALAAAYALRRELGVAWFDASLDGMVFSHGALNGLLFAGGVLLAEPAHPRRR